MTSRKRKKMEENMCDNDIQTDISKILLEDCDLDITILLRIRNHLQNSKDKESEVQAVKLKIEQRFIIHLLCQYDAMESEKDKAIFDILCLLERSYQISLRPFFPMVWGKRAKDNYEKLRQLGELLHTKLTTDQVLDYLNPKLVWSTLLKSEQTTSIKIPEKDSSNQFYDARFILRLLATLLDNDAKMNSRKFIAVNGLSLAFAATSFISRSERCVAYLVLRRFLLHLTELDTDSFPEKCLYIYLLQIFKNSIENPIQRLPHVVAHFFARVTKLILHPEDPVYQPVLSFLLLKPNIDVQNVPEIYKLLLSSSTEHYNKERHWCLRLILDSLIEPNDYNILQKRFLAFRYGIKLLLSLFGSVIADQETRKYILLSFRAILQHRSLANDLYVRQNLHSWIVLTLQNSKMTSWERVFLCQLFITLITHIKDLYSGSANNDSVETNWRKTIVYKTCQILGNKVCNELEKENNDAKNTWLPQLRQLLCKDSWMPSIESCDVQN
uniref:Nucleolar pre-ribosomal-associated protein 1 C-terminal domain-containing protein n=2 Tax=Wuchereria bancrofti TaxID=6293 RepID=A0AAF5PRM4_WUCBA